MASLVIMVMSGPDDGQEIHLSREHNNGEANVDGSWTVWFGRREECDISIPFDTQVSRRHATLRVTPEDEFWLRDEQSLNGTFVEKERIEAATQVRRGQLFRLGRTWLRIQAEVEDTGS
jgi:pSer/pThr/pTyr-binding forkhead associated (FHA) protein